MVNTRTLPFNLKKNLQNMQNFEKHCQWVLGGRACKTAENFLPGFYSFPKTSGIVSLRFQNFLFWLFILWRNLFPAVRGGPMSVGIGDWKVVAGFRDLVWAVCWGATAYGQLSCLSRIRNSNPSIYGETAPPEGPTLSVEIAHTFAFGLEENG